MTAIDLKFFKKDSISEGMHDFRFHILKFSRLRLLKYRTTNMVSLLILSLFADFYPPLKH